MCTHYMRIPTVVSLVMRSAVYAAQSHDIINDTMNLSGNGTKTSRERAYSNVGTSLPTTGPELVLCVPSLRLLNVWPNWGLEFDKPALYRH